MLKNKGISPLMSILLLIVFILASSFIIFNFMKKIAFESSYSAQEKTIEIINWINEDLRVLVVTNRRIVAFAPNAPESYTVLKVYVDGDEYEIINRTFGNIIQIDLNKTIPEGRHKLILLSNTNRSWIFEVYVSPPPPSQRIWLDGFTYRKPITINNTLNSNNLNDYQVNITLDTQSLISNGKMQSDCADIRFTDSDGTTLLNYWIESGCNTTNTKIWVKVPFIQASSTKTIYVYYGNPSATSQSSTTNTFIREIDGVVGSWHLDEGIETTIYDYSGNNNNGVYYGNNPHSQSNSTILQLNGNLTHYFYLPNKTILSDVNLTINYINNTIILVNWQYRKPITINNTQNSNTLTDYQVLVTLDTASLISDGKMRSDCGDIRFTDSDGTLLNYWLESGCNSASTKIWVKVPNIPANSNKTIYVYYGNPNANSMSNASVTMFWYDDFSTDPSSRYDFYVWYYSPTWSWDSANQWVVLRTNTNYGTMGVLQKDLSKNITNAVVDIDYYVINRVNSWNGILGRYTGTTEGSGYRAGINYYVAQMKITPPDTGTSITNPADGYWYHLRAIFSGSNIRVNLYTSPIKPSDSPIPYASYSVTDATYSSGRFGFNAYYTDSRYDNLIVRKYSYPEPTISIGNEEIVNNTIRVFINGNFIGSLNDNGETSPTSHTFYNILKENFTIESLNSITYEGFISNITQSTLNYLQDIGWIDGKFGKALIFDGVDDYIDVGNSSTLNITSNLSIQAWIKPFSIKNQKIGIAGKGDAITKNYDLFIDIDSKPMFTVDGLLYNNFVKGNNTIEIGEWYYLVGVYEQNSSPNVNGSLKIYVNGNIENTLDASGIPQTLIRAVSIGCQGVNSCYDNSLPFNGIIDEVKIFNKSLTQEEVLDLYNNYGYTTPNYPGKVLVRKYSYPEPAISLGNEET